MPLASEDFVRRRQLCKCKRVRQTTLMELEAAAGTKGTLCDIQSHVRTLL